MTVEPPSDGISAGPVSPPNQPPPRARHRRRARTAAIGAAVAAAAAGGGGWWLATNAGATGTPAVPVVTGPPATAAVTRQDLVDTQQVDGTLGYGDEHQLAGGSQGVLTWLPAAGSTVSRGKALYRVDNEPVVLLYGSMPLYRKLTVDVEGPDVQELEANLAALGYTGFTVDDAYTVDTADAVKKWQADLGLTETGVVEAGRVVVASGVVRVGDAKADVGARTAPGQPVLTYTGTTRIVSVDLDVNDQELARKGGEVTVVLPAGPRLKGTVTSVGTVAQAAGTPATGGTAAGDNSSSSNDATIEVTIALDNPKGTGTLDQAPVDVEFVSEQRKAVLTVPVAALLALREGGYGVEIVDAGGARVVAVKVGMFADGRVEITGTGLAAGTKVGVPPA
jgi:hypothetical protein